MYDILTADAGLTRKLPHGLTLRAGLRYTRNGMADKSHYAAQTQGTWLALPEYSYDQHYTEQIGAAYASLEYSAGRWELSAGLRGEYTSVASQTLDRSYFGLFPNVSVSRALNALRTWLLVAQWSRNIERPAFPALNPARIRISDYSWQSGNPSLRPTYIHRFSLTAVWKYRYTLTVGGNLHHDLIREIAHRDETDPDAVYIRPENHYTENHWFVAASVPAKITRWWNLSVNAVGVMQRIPAQQYRQPGDALPDVRRRHLLVHAAGRILRRSRLPCPEPPLLGQQRGRPRHTLSATVKKQLFGQTPDAFLHPVEHHRLRLGVRIPDRRHAPHDRRTAGLVGAFGGKPVRPGISAPAKSSAPAPSKAQRKPSASAS